MDKTLVTRVTKGGEEVRIIQTCLVEVLSGKAAGQAVAVEKPVFRIGSHATNDLLLPDETVSKHHLELSIMPDGYRITDLSSSNGTYLGAVRVGEVTVTDGVMITVGGVSLKVKPSSLEKEVPASTKTSFGRLIGKSPIIRELFGQLEVVARSDVSLLLEGETGVGKELVAESIHQQSQRAKGPFIVVDCAAMSSELMESELFGHTKGAFTGADTERKGLLQSANGGTVFLDEVGELPLQLQVKLLGVLERRKVTPLGTSVGQSIDVRVIAATHRELAREVNRGTFRADLFHRLAVVRLTVPALRERPDDIPLLVDKFLADLRARDGVRIPSELSAVTLAHLLAQPWPGNVRELRNAIERAVLMLPEKERTAPGAPGVQPLLTARTQATEEFKRQDFSQLLAQPDMNMSKLARIAGIDRRYLYRILKQLGLKSSADEDPISQA